MPVATKSQKCPTCGAKSPADAERCRICTRAFTHDAPRSQAAFEDALYSQPVRGAAPARAKRSILPFVAVAVAALLAYNYFELGYGPAWAHRSEAHPPGGNWRTYTGVPGMTVFLPGAPIESTVTTANGALRTARVGVDDHWDAILDARVTSSGAKRAAASSLTATLTVGSSAAPTDIATEAAPLVAALLPGTQLSDSTLVERVGGGARRTYDVVAAFRGYPDPTTNGTVRARIVVADGRATVVASYFPGPQSTDLHEHLLEGFTPDGAP